jgi:hypothetical protein
MQRAIIAAGEFAALGAWQAQDETTNEELIKKNLRLESLVKTEQALTELPFPGDLRIGIEMVQAQQTAIRTLLLNINLPPSDRNSYMTATETSVRQADFFQQVGQPAKRMKFELLQPMVEQIYRRLSQRGELPEYSREIPPALQAEGFPEIETQGDIFALDVSAAIEQAVKQSQGQQDLQSVTLLTQAVGPEEVQALVDLERFSRILLQNLNFSPEAIRSPEDMQAQRDAAIRKTTELRKVVYERMSQSHHQYAKFSDRLRELLEKLDGDQMSQADKLKMAEELAKDLDAEAKAHEGSGLSEGAYGILQVLRAFDAGDGADVWQ